MEIPASVVWLKVLARLRGNLCRVQRCTFVSHAIELRSAFVFRNHHALDVLGFVTCYADEERVLRMIDCADR